MKRLKLNIQKFGGSGRIQTPANEDGSYFYLDWRSGENVAGNYSSVSYSFGIYANYDYYTNAIEIGPIQINGQTVYSGRTTGNVSRPGGVLQTGGIRVYHNDDGTKSFSITISGWTIGCSWVSKTQTFTLPRIPRASKIDSVVFDLDSQNRPDNIEENFAVNYTRYASQFTDNLVMKIRGNTIRRIENYVSGDTISFTQTELNSLYTEMYAENGSTIKFQLETYNGDTLIGTSDEFGKVVNIYDADPTFSGVTFEDTNNTTLALTGNNQIIVKGYSNATLTIPVATGNKGATIVDYVIEGVDEPVTHTGSPLTYTINGCTFGTFNVYARDSRGNTKLSTVIASSTKSYENIYLDVSESKIERWDNDRASATGNEAKLTLSGTIWNNNFGSVNNSITSSEYRLKITDSSGDPVLGTTDITPTINQDGTIIFSNQIRSDNPDYSWNIGDSYYVYITVADELSSSSIVLTLNSAKPNIAIHKNGVGIGAAYDTSVGGSLQIDGEKYEKVNVEKNYSTSQTDTYCCDYINNVNNGSKIVCTCEAGGKTPRSGNFNLETFSTINVLDNDIVNESSGAVVVKKSGYYKITFLSRLGDASGACFIGISINNSNGDNYGMWQYNHQRLNVNCSQVFNLNENDIIKWNHQGSSISTLAIVTTKFWVEYIPA